ncbi:MAG: fibronectin type III domain-containing protein, partial [Muribaculaceae bacterium]|nr:fibronectin type III domain-containing protein [Muribaculaceae bacterium]
MDKILKYLMLVIVSISGLTFTSCGGDDDDKNSPSASPSFAGSTIFRDFSDMGGTFDCYINSCNYMTSMRTSVIWITPYLYSQEGRCTIKVAENTSSEEREGTVELVYNGQVVDTYTIIQRGKGSNSGGGDIPEEPGVFGAPTGLTCSKNGYAVTLSWNKVPKAEKYWIYYSNPTAFSYGQFVTMENTTSTTFTMNCKIAGNWAFKVQAQRGSEFSDYSNVVTTTISESDINGGGGGGGSQQKPAAPTGVTVSNEGNNYIPDVRVRWNEVSNATSYYIYKSTSANGTYSKIGETSYASYGYADSNAPTNGGTAYYKVKAVNSYGESPFSDYAKYTATTNDEGFAPAYTYGNCTVSGSNMTLRWTNSTGYGYGKATKIVLRVWNPYAEEWQDTELSPTATSASFNFSTKIDDSGYVKAGIVVSNDKGSYTAGAKI